MTLGKVPLGFAWQAPSISVGGILTSFSPKQGKEREVKKEMGLAWTVQYLEATLNHSDAIPNFKSADLSLVSC